MAEEQVPYLEEWCREFPAGTSADSRTARSAAIQKVATDLGKQELENLLRLAFDLSLPIPESSESKIREALNGADNSFSLTGNPRELKLMAGAILSAMAKGQDKTAATYAATVEATGTANLRQSNLPVNLVGYCSRQVLEVAAFNRKRLDIRRQPAAAPAVNFTAVPDAEVTAAHINAAILGAATAAVNSAITGMRSVISHAALTKSVTILEEELQILWWLTNQWSDSADKAFSDVPAVQRPLYFADDLASTTNIFPGGANIRPLLLRADIGEQELGVIEAVNAVDREWATKKIAGRNLSPITTPLHFALQRRLETPDDNAWGHGWSSATGAPANCRLHPVDLGLQYFREALLLKQQ